jgi:probable rRNA maturation factor
VAFVGEGRMRLLNAAHRGRDEVTDVLSFPLEEAGEWEDEPEGWGDAAEAGVSGAEVATAVRPPRLLGDVVICARQALRQARADGLPPAFELALLLTHGTLHLLGYDHEVDAGQMAVRQAEVLELIEWEGLVAPPR